MLPECAFLSMPGLGFDGTVHLPLVPPIPAAAAPAASLAAWVAADPQLQHALQVDQPNQPANGHVQPDEMAAGQGWQDEQSYYSALLEG